MNAAVARSRAEKRLYNDIMKKLREVVKTESSKGKFQAYVYLSGYIPKRLIETIEADLKKSGYFMKIVHGRLIISWDVEIE